MLSLMQQFHKLEHFVFALQYRYRLWLCARLLVFATVCCGAIVRFRQFLPHE